MNTAPILEKLFALIDADAGFAGFGAAARNVATLDGDDARATRQLTQAFLGDAGLTAQLLRKANASGRAGKSVATIDQALVIIGIDKVQALAASLLAADAPGTIANPAQAGQVNAEFVAAAFCGLFAAALTRANAARQKPQEAQVCGLLQNLGRILACCYLYDDVVRSQILQAEQNLPEDEAVRRTLGLSFDDISAAVAQRWNFPDTLQRSLDPANENIPPQAMAKSPEWHQYCGRFSRRITNILFRQPEHQARGAIAGEIYLYRNMLHLKDAEVIELVESVQQELDEMLATMSAPSTAAQARDLLRKSSERVTDWLSSQDSLTKSSDTDIRKTRVEVIYQILRSIHDEFHFDMTLLCVPNGTAELVAISGVGRNANQIISRFRCGGTRHDLFRSVAAKPVGLYVGDVRAGPYAKLIPDWYPKLVGAQSLYLMSLMHKNEQLGIVYGDFTDQRDLSPTGLDGPKMRQWRTELIAALRPVSGVVKV